jgi:hypothetical protein
VVFGEDQSQVHNGHTEANLGRLRRLALNLLRRDQTSQRGAKGKQLNAALKPDYALRLLEDTPNRLMHQLCWQANRHPATNPFQAFRPRLHPYSPFFPLPNSKQKIGGQGQCSDTSAAIG